MNSILYQYCLDNGLVFSDSLLEYCEQHLDYNKKKGEFYYSGTDFGWQTTYKYANNSKRSFKNMEFSREVYEPKVIEYFIQKKIDIRNEKIDSILNDRS